ncbi:MAG: hypothetical protein ACOYWZ_23830 [Bacillota bacterium]
MRELIKSASKIVFIMLAGTSCAAYLIGLMDTKDFMILASMAFSFYFSSKGETTQPYGGK